MQTLQCMRQITECFTNDFWVLHRCRKPMHQYMGPFKILQLINKVNCMHNLPRQYHIASSFHVAKFKPWIPGPMNEGSLPLSIQLPSVSKFIQLTALRTSWIPDFREVEGSVCYTGRDMILRREAESQLMTSQCTLESFIGNHPNCPAPYQEEGFVYYDQHGLKMRQSKVNILYVESN